MALTVDRPAVIAGARLAVIIGAAAIALAQAITSLTDSDANLPLYMVLLGGLGAGGRLAALRQPQSPLTHGALAAMSAYVVLIVAITVIRLALGKEVADPVSLVFNGLMAASAGMFGGYLAVRQASREA
jgi:putative membrane protein (TIGR04086 family)